MKAKKVSIAVIAALIVFALGVGIWFTRSQAGRTATITGTATVAPVSPTCQFNGPCSHALISYEVEVDNAAGNKVASVKSDKKGVFSVNVKPGNYSLVGRAVPTNAAIDGAQETVQVDDGGTASLVMHFDSGIR